MALLKIARMGNPVLRSVAEPVPDPTVPEIARLIADMTETMMDAPGVGLAAPQVHVPLRVIVFHVPAVRAAAEPGAAGTEEEGPVPLTALINPDIDALDGDGVVAYEGCLSIPGLTGPVLRAKRIRYRGVSPSGSVIERVARGFHARVVQHEVDHLNGILYPDRVTDLTQLGFVDEIERLRGAISVSAGARRA